VQYKFHSNTKVLIKLVEHVLRC